MDYICNCSSKYTTHMFSRKSQYAIRALLCLAHHQETGTAWLGTHYIATETGIPKKWLANIFLELRSAGVVKSKKGAHGGYFLPEKPEDLTLARILDVTEGAKGNTLKSDGEEIPIGIDGIMDYIGPVIDKLQAANIRILDKTTLGHLLQNHQK